MKRSETWKEYKEWTSNHLYSHVVCLLCADIRLFLSSSSSFYLMSCDFFFLGLILFLLSSKFLRRWKKEKKLCLSFQRISRKENMIFPFSFMFKVVRRSHNILFNMLCWYCRSSLVITSEISPVTGAKSGLMKRERLLISVWHQIQRASPRAVLL